MTLRSYFAPANVDDALALVAKHGREGVIAGGTDAVVKHRAGKRPLSDVIIGIHRLVELRGLRAEDRSLSVGALTTHSGLVTSNEILSRYPALADASSIVGSQSTQHVGTVGGNVVNASPALDTGSPLLVLEATAELRSVAGTRRLGIGELWDGPGQSTLGEAELLTRLVLPPVEPRSSSAYLRLEYRRAMEIAVAGAAVALTLEEDGSVASAAVALTAVAPTCFVSPAAGLALVGHRPEGSALRDAGEAAAEAARPISDNRASAAYRRRMVAVLTMRAIGVAAARAAGQPVAVPASQHWADRGALGTAS